MKKLQKKNKKRKVINIIALAKTFVKVRFDGKVAFDAEQTLSDDIASDFS